MSNFGGHGKADRNLAGCLSPLIFVGGLLIILYTTLKPFEFQFRSLTLGDYLAGYEIPPSSFLDFPRNILLFVPIGFSLAAILDQRGWPRSRIRLAVLACGFLLTLMVESLQQFLSFRQPSAADLIANTLGALAGLACYRLWQNREATAEWLKEALIAPPKVLAALAIYALLLLFMAYGLSSSVQYYDWDVDYRLMLGNEATGDRQWHGSVRDLIVFDRVLENDQVRHLLNEPELALTNNEGLLAYYPLTEGSPEPDLAGKQPSLIWLPTTEINKKEHTPQFGGNHWLASESAVKELSVLLQESSQLTVRLTVATAELEQGGPARIVTISEDTLLRNLTLGQEGNDLVMRFRSFLTGENGTSPQIVFPGFFTNSDPVEFVVTFDGLAIELIDSRSETAKSVEMVPGIAFYYSYIDLILNPNISFGQVSAGTISNWIYRLLYYICVLLPVGILLSLPALKAWSQSYRIILILCSLLGIPLLLELGQIACSGLGLRPTNVVTSVLVIVIVAWVLMPLARRLISLLTAAHARRG